MNIVARAFVVSAVACATGLRTPAQQAAQVPEWAQRALEEAHTHEGMIEFYGKVIDQTGVPISGAKVSLHIQGVRVLYIDGFPPVRLDVLSDEDGLFCVAPSTNKLRGINLYIDSITKSGYEEERLKWPTQNKHYSFDKDDPHGFKPDRDAPEIFLMRKKNEHLTFLIESSCMTFVFHRQEGPATRGYDFVRRTPFANQRAFSGDTAARNDLHLSGTQDVSSSSWTLVFTPLGPDSGIVATSEFLDEAPLNGYSAEYVLIARGHEVPRWKFLYIKTRNPPIYSRLEIQAVVATDEFVSVDAKAWTNPYGDRSLESVGDIPWSLQTRLIEEARMAHEKGERPPRPEKAMLLEAAKKEQERKEMQK